jgi:hypothetical protein
MPWIWNKNSGVALNEGILANSPSVYGARGSSSVSLKESYFCFVTHSLRCRYHTFYYANVSTPHCNIANNQGFVVLTFEFSKNEQRYGQSCLLYSIFCSVIYANWFILNSARQRKICLQLLQYFSGTIILSIIPSAPWKSTSIEWYRNDLGRSLRGLETSHFRGF